MKNIKNYFNDYKHGNKLKLKLKFIISSLISIINFIISIIILHTYTICNTCIYGGIAHAARDSKKRSATG